jgi:tRNA(Arg) A34 adenosine deaminase TadA
VNSIGRPSAAFMELAIRAARAGMKRHDGGPFGACLVRNGRPLATSHNRVLRACDATCHAEINAIRAASRKLKTPFLRNTVLYSTTEPCPMCFAAIHWAQIPLVVYGTSITDVARRGFNELSIENSELKKLGKSPVKLVRKFMRNAASCFANGTGCRARGRTDFSLHASHFTRYARFVATACYLDIETTGLSPQHSVPSVVGLLVGDQFFQWHGEDITDINLLDALPGDATIHTYNGHRFDLPFLEYHLKIKFRSRFNTVDLMFDCWRHGLRGGLKKVQRTLGIGRQDEEANGYMAVVLWQRWLREGDQDALTRLLAYNREDVEVLPRLQAALQQQGAKPNYGFSSRSCNL